MGPYKNKKGLAKLTKYGFSFTSSNFSGYFLCLTVIQNKVSPVGVVSTDLTAVADVQAMQFVQPVRDGLSREQTQKNGHVQ